MQLIDLEPCLFPRLSSQPQNSRRTLTVHRSSFEWHDLTSSSTLLQCLMSAWAILLSTYTGSSIARFGVISGASEGCCKVLLEEWSASLEPAKCVEKTVSLAKERCELNPREDRHRGRFNSCIVLGSQVTWLKRWIEELNDPIELVLLAEEYTETIRITLYSRSWLLDKEFVPSLSGVLQHILRRMSWSPDSLLRELDLTPEEHCKRVNALNESISKEPLDECVHHMIQRQCEKHPDVQAICAWDGALTYSELEHLSTDVTRMLLRHAVGPEIIVPLLFEKSKWTAVAMLGVLKAGAAIVLLDPAYPIDRLQGICQDVKPKVILTSESHVDTASYLATAVLTVPGFATLTELENTASIEETHQRTRVDSRNAAYISYTSGSTGKPKGVVIEHASMCTNAVLSSKAQGLTEYSRVLQFASYAFDVSIHETLVPLILGGCVCIPSTSQRLNQLQEAINELRVNWMELTPSVVRSLNPEELPGVKTLVVGGESISPTELARWAGRLTLNIAYGPAECTVVSTVQSQVSTDGDPLNIGRGSGGTTWVVKPENHEMLVPIGAIGELVIGGPIVGRGYLHRPEQTAAAFIANPPWFTHESQSRRFYKTGDLVRQQPDGTLIYLGRKDTQVKLRGQRIELGEIEHHAEALFQEAAIVVELGKLYHGQPALVLFIEWEPFKDRGKLNEDLPFCKPNRLFTMQAQKAKLKLQTVLPRHMVPELLIPLCSMPLSQTAKVDRKGLRSMISRLSKAELQMYRLGARPKFDRDGVKCRNGRSQTELIELVARILALTPEKISEHDNFFHLGGDSISAIILAREMQKVLGLNVAVTDIFRNPTLNQLCGLAKTQGSSTFTDTIPLNVAPFSMLEPQLVETLKNLAAEQCGITRSEIEDIYPCSPLQERFMARTARQPGAFQAQFTFNMPATVNWRRFRWAWNAIADAHAILRTRLINVGQPQFACSVFQVVVRDSEIDWFNTSRQEDGKWEKDMSFGTPLVYLVASHGSSEPTFSLVMHHTIFDWWSYNEILHAVEKAYEGQPVIPRQFSPFIRHIYELDKHEAREFWKGEFSGLTAAPFLARSSPSSVPQAIQGARRDFRLRMSSTRGITMSAMIRLAWAMVVARHTDSLDVVFGVTVMGRNIPGAADISGPTIATYPLRIILRQDISVDEALRRIQHQNTELIPFEQTGIQEIRQASPEAAMACTFQSLLIVQPQKESSALVKHSPSPFWKLKEPDSSQQQSYINFSTQVLNVVCEPKADTLRVDAFFDQTTLSLEEVQSMLKSMEDMLGYILGRPDAGIGSLVQKNNAAGTMPPTRNERSILTTIESVARKFLNGNFPVLAEWISPKKTRTSKLVLFVGVSGMSKSPQDGLILTTLPAHIQTRMLQLTKYIQDNPSCAQVPFSCVPVQLPPPGIDRILVKKAASEMTWAGLRSWQNAGSAHLHQPHSPVEITLKQALATALRLDYDDIGVEDDFFSLGCDSLIAMQFAAQCNRHNMTVTVSDIFDSRSVTNLASKISNRSLPSSLKSENFSLVRAIYGDLQAFEQDIKGLVEISRLSQVVDAFPCTSSHLGLLNPDAHLQSHTVWEVSDSSDKIDPFQLAIAWRRLVSRHATLRTVLLQGRTVPSRLFHLVLDSYPVDVSIVTDVDDQNKWSVIRKPFLSACGQDALPYKFTIYQTRTGRVLCKLEGRYAFLDATSVLIILQELESAYDKTLSSTSGPLYRSWVSFLDQWNNDNSHLQFWKHYLAGTQPCILKPSPYTNGPKDVGGDDQPREELQTYTTDLIQTDVVRRYCDQRTVSVSNVIHVAWGLVLKQLTGSDDVCFGSLVSGRDAPVPHVNELVGSLFNVLICRLFMPENTPLRRVIQNNEDAFRARLAHQHCSLSDVTFSSTGGDISLFNTCLSIEQPLSSRGRICFTELETNEGTEYDLVVTVSVSPDTISSQLTFRRTFMREEQAVVIGEAFNQGIKLLMSCETTDE